MNFQVFKGFFECGANLAKQIALANGVKLPQVELWIAQLSGGVK